MKEKRKRKLIYSDRHSGFTLIEMMVVVAIVAVLAAIAIPSFSDFIQKNRVKNVTEEIYGLLSQAKSEAVARNADITISIDEDAWCVGYSTVAGCDCTSSLGDGDECAVNVAGTNVLKVLDGNEFANVNIASNMATTTINHLRGTAANGTITITSGNWGLGITLTTLGRFRVCEPSGGGIEPISRNVYTACP